MMQKYRNGFRNIPWSFWALLLITGVGIFFRSYHFAEWLPFEGDAFRDATMISKAYRDGVASLPLLGPRAAGTMLRLGPIFYDFQYVSALMFRSVSAPVLAYPDLFFSILSIPTFYFFSRRYFSPAWALVLAGMLATSFLGIEYGRFAWNPNATIFFTLLFSYAVLRLYDAESESKHPLLLSCVAGVSLAVAGQLHFVAFLGLPLVLLIFLLSHIGESRQRLSVPIVAVFLLSVFILFAPVVVSDVFKSGENTRLFFSALSSKSGSAGIVPSIMEDGRMFAKYFLRVWIGMVEPGRKWLVLSGLAMLFGLFANVFLLRGERNRAKRHFLQWTLIVFAVYFLLYIPLAFEIDRPRFFLPVMTLPYLFAAYALFWLRNVVSFPRWSGVLIVLCLSVIVALNVKATLGWFTILSRSQQTMMSVDEGNTKRGGLWLTWGNFERVATDLDASCPQSAPVHLLMARNIASFDHSIEYALLQRTPKRAIYIEERYVPNGGSGCYYFLSLPGASASESVRSAIQDPLVLVGGLQVIRVYPNGREDSFTESDSSSSSDELSPFQPEKRTRNSRIFWGDIWYSVAH